MDRLSLELAAGEAIKASSDVQAIVAELYERGKLPMYLLPAGAVIEPGAVISYARSGAFSDGLTRIDHLGKGNEC